MNDNNFQIGGSNNKQQIDNSNNKESLVTKIIVGVIVTVIGGLVIFYLTK